MLGLARGGRARGGVGAEFSQFVLRAEHDTQHLSAASVETVKLVVAGGGVRGVGVLSGAGTREKLQAEKPAVILKSVAELPQWLTKLG